MGSLLRTACRRTQTNMPGRTLSAKELDQVPELMKDQSEESVESNTELAKAKVGSLADRSTSIGHRSHGSHRSNLFSGDEISTSLSEGRLGSLNLHGVGSLGSLNSGGVSRGDGTVGMADNSRGSLADRSTSIGHRSHGSHRSNLSSRDEISTSLSEGRLGSLNLHGVRSLGSLNSGGVSRGDGTIGMADN